MRDIRGREIREFDLLKVFHFVGPRRKKYFMYKWVKKIGGHLCGFHLDAEGDDSYYRLVPRKDGILQGCEIIQGYNGGYFEDRKIVDPKPSGKGE